MEGKAEQSINTVERIITDGEYHGHFRDLASFRSFFAEIVKLKDVIIQSILHKILTLGIYDRLFEIHYSPKEVKISSENYRETITAGKLISRTRAVLCEYKCVAKKNSILNDYNNKDG